MKVSEGIAVYVSMFLSAMGGVSGFMLKTAILKSAVGSVAGIENFTSIKVKHTACLNKPFRLNDRTYLDR